MAASNLRRLTKEVEDQYGFLFTEDGARVVPESSNGYSAMDFATVVLQLSHLYLRAVRDRGHTNWYASLDGSESSWQRLDLILKTTHQPQPLPYYSDDELLRHHLPEIERLLKAEGDPQ